MNAIHSTIFVLTFLGVSAQAEEATILAQPNSPLEIESYTNRYAPPDRVGNGTVIHRASVRNTSGQVVEAYGLGFYIFDAFKRDMGRPFIGYAMDRVVADATDSPGWEQRPGSAFLFDNHGHGLAYVAIARMKDGTIWKADNSDIQRQLEDFQFTLSDGSE